MAKIHFKGKGEHSVNELERLAEQNKEDISSLRNALLNFVDAIDLLSNCKGELSEERKEVYVMMKKSLTYSKAVEALAS